MRIGQVARQAGVNVDTVRYYERRGILPDPRRTVSGYRDYGPEAPRVIRFVKRAQELGFTLREIQELLRLRRTRSADRARVRTVAEKKIEDIQEKLRCLEAMHAALATLVESCDCNEGAPRCPILEALEDEPEDDDSPITEGG